VGRKNKKQNLLKRPASLEMSDYATQYKRAPLLG
jgi:hypothetical protein